MHTHALAAVCELVSHVPIGELVLVVSPDEQVDAFRTLPIIEPSQIWPQGTGDLGARMSRAVAHAFDNGAARVILLGADSPTLPGAFLEKAAHLLCDHDVVLGPSSDGGYYLMGLSKPLHKLFDAVDWGTASVLERTRALAQQINADVVELAEWYDLDRYEDLPIAAADLANISDESMALRPSLVSLRTLIGQLMNRAAKHE